MAVEAGPPAPQRPTIGVVTRGGETITAEEHAARQNTEPTSGGAAPTAPAPPVNVNSTPVSPDSDLATASDEDILDYLYKQYGYLAWALDIPEVRTTLIEAVRDGKGEMEIMADIRATTWWQTTEASVRSYIRMSVEDPAQLASLIAEASMDVELLAAQLGVQLSDSRIQEMADLAVRFSWGEDDYQRAVVAESSFDPDIPVEGLIGDQTYDAKALANQYLVPISDASAHDWATRILSGEATLSGFEAYLRNMAIGQFPHLKQYIEQGITPAQYFEPYVQTASRTLERQFTLGDMQSGPLSEALQVYDENTGEIRPMTLTEFNRELRKTPEWQRTSNAKETASRVAFSLGQLFGRA